MPILKTSCRNVSLNIYNHNSFANNVLWMGSCCHSCRRLLFFVGIAICGGPTNWCSCAPRERAAGKCHCFSIARAGEASWLEICSVAHGWVLQWLACGRAEEEQRRWQPWFSCRFFKVDERENANTNTYQWYIQTVTSLVVSNFLVVWNTPTPKGGGNLFISNLSQPPSPTAPFMVLLVEQGMSRPALSRQWHVRISSVSLSYQFVLKVFGHSKRKPVALPLLDEQDTEHFQKLSHGSTI